MNKLGKALLRSHVVNSALFLILPGLGLKRWIALGIFGISAFSLGMLFALEIPVGPRFQSLIGVISMRDTDTTIRAGVFIGLGAIFTGTAFIGLGSSIAFVWLRRRHLHFLDSLYLERVLSNGPNIVAIGGGSGLPNLLRGLKYYSSNITAIVTVADDGGSSGRLRAELGILPPGDLRNCLVALADSEAIMQQLMDYRFSSNGELDGHSFGNILIAALASIGGDFHKGVEAAGELLGIRGKVIPSTTSAITLEARTMSGERLVGESRVGNSRERLMSLTLSPPDAPADADAVRAIMGADLLIIGPGSLYTSIVPNLLIREVAASIAKSNALKMYVCNVVGEPGETEGYSVDDHVNVISHYVGDATIDLIITNDNLKRNRSQTIPELASGRENSNNRARTVSADVIDEDRPSQHDPTKLASVVSETYRKYRGKRRRLPILRRNLQPNTITKNNGPKY